MKHIVIGASQSYQRKYKGTVDVEKYARREIAARIGEEILKSDLIEFRDPEIESPHDITVIGEIVVIKLSDYNKLVRTVSKIGDFRIIEDEKEISLRDLL